MRVFQTTSQTREMSVFEFWMHQELQATMLHKEFYPRRIFLFLIKCFLSYQGSLLRSWQAVFHLMIVFILSSIFLQPTNTFLQPHQTFSNFSSLRCSEARSLLCPYTHLVGYINVPNTLPIPAHLPPTLPVLSPTQSTTLSVVMDVC